MSKETRLYVWTSGYGRWAQSSEVTVECVEQRGKFYASVHTLNASAIGVGDTPDQAFAAWAAQCNATPKASSSPAGRTLLQAEMKAGCVAWKCPKCGHLTTDVIGEEGPFGELYCDDCMEVAQRPDLAPEEVAQWDAAIEALQLSADCDLGLSYVRR